MKNLNIHEEDEGVLFTVKIIPASSKTALAGLLEGTLKIKISAPPQKGKANQALIRFLAEKLGVKKNSIKITSGQTKEIKTIKIAGLSAQKLQNKLTSNT